MPSTPADLNHIEQDILEAASVAAEAITQRLIELWRDEYASNGSKDPVLFDAFEHVVQFEVACRLRERLQREQRSWQYVSWEHRYSKSYGGQLDLVVSCTQKQADLDERIAIEVKWMGEKRGGVAGAASDALKLMWASASARYVLIFGRHRKETLVERIRAATQDDIQMAGWLSTPSELKLARSLLDSASEPLMLAGYSAARHPHDVAVALVRVPDFRPASELAADGPRASD